MPSVEKPQIAAVELEAVDPCCSKAVSVVCFGAVGISFFVVFVIVTSVMVFASDNDFCNGYVSLLRDSVF